MGWPLPMDKASIVVIGHSPGIVGRCGHVFSTSYIIELIPWTVRGRTVDDVGLRKSSVEWGLIE